MHRPRRPARHSCLGPSRRRHLDRLGSRLRAEESSSIVTIWWRLPTGRRSPPCSPRRPPVRAVHHDAPNC